MIDTSDHIRLRRLREDEIEELELADDLERVRNGVDEEIAIDISGPGGNAFYIIGIISRRGRRIRGRR